jgi:hypothetical protein
VDIQCINDCSPSPLLVGLFFVFAAGPGYLLARWRRWTLLGWLPLTALAAALLLRSEWGLDEWAKIALGLAWCIALLGGFRRTSRSLPDHP